MDESRVAVTSFINYSITYDRYIADVFGNKDVKCITPIMVEKFYLTLNKKQKLKVSTVNSVHTVLHMILEYALKSRWILSNPSSGCMKCLDNAKRREKHEGPLTLSKQVLCSYLKYLVKEGSKMSTQAIIILVIAFVGCRFGEAAGLRDVDIDYEKKMISINHTLWYRNRKDLGDSRKCGFGVTPAKSAKSVRCLPMENEGLLDLFRKCADGNKKLKRCVIDGYSGFLFVKETGFPYTNKDINIYLRKSIKRYNDYEITEAEKEQREPLLMPENITVHIFRRTAATLMLENGYQMPDIMSILGHVDLRTTSEHYCFPSMEHKSKVIKCLPIGEVEI